MNTCSRRDFLTHLGWLATAGTVGGLAVASGRYMFADVLYEPPRSYKIENPLTYPDGVSFIAEKRIFVLREQNRIHVVSAVCTHIGCTTRWVGELNRFECPCHGSVFNKKGEVLTGPAPKPLPWYLVMLSPDGRLLVNEAKVVPYDQTLLV